MNPPARDFQLVAAPYTPFDAGGELDLERVDGLARGLEADGVTGAFVAGSTGEGLSLTTDERRALAERWMKSAGGLRVIVHVGHASLREAQELARHAASIGAHATAAAPPSWYPLGSADALLGVLAELASAAPETPLLYYHIPALSGVHVPMAALAERARTKLPSLAGIKYTHLDPVDFQLCIREHGEALEFLWGMDEALLLGLGLGAHGAVGSTYNFIAPLYLRLFEAWRSGDHLRAQELQSRSAQLVEVLARRGYMGSSKHVMGVRGRACGPVRRPLESLDDGALESLQQELRETGMLQLLEEPDRA